jgi:hypothetical protein
MVNSWLLRVEPLLNLCNAKLPQLGTEPRLQLRGDQLNINLLKGGQLIKLCII